ncbi:hypothetical protein XA68_18160 [Ophiocordyceps unilateralis]|uniref:Uncharacterized protein n=1 Tax=Ophiocordyceps unilateralis TaxID=268505 RepID=A0A2A9P3M7_OPHUN|nr:hypothetical protein XA68_18160 [Ophiocordyceps unilateralis]
MASTSTTHLQVPSSTTTTSSSLSSSSSSSSSSSPTTPVRPAFNSHLTSDRLREGAGLYLPPPFRTDHRSNIRKGRTSVFKEMGLDLPLDHVVVSPAEDDVSPVVSPAEDDA